MARGVNFESEMECGRICEPFIQVVAAAVAPTEAIAAVIAAMMADFTDGPLEASLLEARI
jgi:hypothetical protein